LDEGHYPVELSLGHDRAHGRCRVGGDAGLKVSDLLFYLCDDRVVNGLMYERSAGRAAGLPAPGEIHAANDPGSNLVGVGIAVGDQRVLAAQFEHGPLDGVGCRFHDRASGWHAADQRDHGDIRVARESLAGFLSSRHNVECARRQQASDQFGKPQGRKGRLLRRFDHHGVTGGERGRGFSRAEHEGVVEGNDAAPTPKGSRTEKLIASGPIGIDAPFISVTKPAKNSICAAAIMASLTISLTGLPQSAASIIASSLAFWRRISAIRRRIFARSSGSTRRHSANATFAEATAASISSAPESATFPRD